MVKFAEVTMVITAKQAISYETLRNVLDVIKDRIDEPQGDKPNNIIEGIEAGVTYKVHRTGYFKEEGF